MTRAIRPASPKRLRTPVEFVPRVSSINEKPRATHQRIARGETHCRKRRHTNLNLPVIPRIDPPRLLDAHQLPARRHADVHVTVEPARVVDAEPVEDVAVPAD